MHFSSRTSWPRQPNRLSQLLDERRTSGSIVCDLTVSNPTECGIAYPEKEILTAIASPQALHYSPHPHGLLTAREAICQYYEKRNVVAGPSDVIVTASTSEAYAMVFKVLCNPGESILVPKPSYPLFEYLAELNDVSLQYYHLRYDHGWHIDIDSLQEACSSATKAIVVVNPHNPTGMFLKKPEFKSLEEIAARNLCALISDEVFSDYAFEEDGNRVLSTANRSDVLTFTLNGISKLAGLPQMKLGWTVVTGPPEEAREALERLEIISDTFLSVNIPVQVALPELLKAGKSVRSEILKRVLSNYAFLENSFTRPTPLSALRSEGGWYAVLKVPRTRTDEEWALQLLEDKGVYLHPGYLFNFDEEGYLVVSLLTEKEKFERGITELVAFIEAAA